VIASSAHANVWDEALSGRMVNLLEAM